MVGKFYEYITGPGLRELNLRGRYQGQDGSGNYLYDTPVEVRASGIGQPFDPTQYLPLAPSLTGTMLTRTTAVLTITEPTNPAPRPPILSYELYRNLNGGEYSLVTTIPTQSSPFSYNDTGLAVNTPEHTWRYYVRAINFDGAGSPSNGVTLQWAGTVLQQPTAPTSLGFSGLGSTQVTLSWQETTDASIDKHGIFNGTTLLVDNISAAARSYTWTGLIPATAYNNITVRRHNASGLGSIPGWSVASNFVQFTTTAGALSPLFTGHVRGKIYLGWSTSQNEDLAENQLNTQTPLPSGTNPASFSDLLGIRRLYNKVNSEINRADDNNRVLWISAKPGEFGSTAGATGWNQIASGARDSQIITYFTSIVARNKLTVFTFNHEPIGDFSNQNTDPLAHNAAHLKIMQVVDANFPGHRILFCPNYEENRLRNTISGTIRWDLLLPENMLPGKGGARPWDFISFDMYQYNDNTATSQTQGVQFSHRWFRIADFFRGTWRPTGVPVMPWMNYNPGVDIVFGIGEMAARAGAFYMFENPSFQDFDDDGNVASRPSNMTGAKYTRDMMDYIFSHLDQFAFVSWFNSIGAARCYNDERLYPSATAFSGDKTPNHPSLIQQTGDTETTINVYREKLKTGLTVKLANNGLPPP